MPRGRVFDVSFLILSSLAVVFALVAYVKDPSLPLVAPANGLALLWFIIPRLVPALILAGMLQVVIPQEDGGRATSAGSPDSAPSAWRAWPA